MVDREHCINCPLRADETTVQHLWACVLLGTQYTTPDCPKGPATPAELSTTAATAESSDAFTICQKGIKLTSEEAAAREAELMRRASLHLQSNDPMYGFRIPPGEN